MEKTCESWIPPSPNLDKVTVIFDKLNNLSYFDLATNLFFYSADYSYFLILFVGMIIFTTTRHNFFSSFDDMNRVLYFDV